ncbi:MAG: hypothetical protein ACPLX8_02115 [Nanopusillaceae archaeon]
MAIYFYLRSFLTSNPYINKLNIRKIKFYFKDAIFVVDDETKNLVDKDYVYIDDVNDWLVIDYGYIPKLKNNKIRVIGFSKDNVIHLSEYVDAVEYLKKNNFKDVILLEKFERIKDKEGWWIYIIYDLFEYDDDLERFLRSIIKDEKTLNLELENVNSFIDNVKQTGYDYFIALVPNSKSSISIIKCDSFSVEYFKTALNLKKLYLRRFLCEDFSIKDGYANIYLSTIDVLNTLAVKIKIPIKDFYNSLEEHEKTLENIRITRVGNRLVIYNEKDIDEIKKIKDKLDDENNKNE